MKLRDVAHEYIRGVELRKQASHISRKALTTKFERSRSVIVKICNRQPVENVPEWEKRLIVQLDKECAAIRREAAAKTMHSLSLGHGYSPEQITRELYLMGYYKEPCDA